MREHELTDWRGALATARLAPNTGMVPLKSSTLLAVEARIEALRKDAERYRWLRDKAPGEIVFDHTASQSEGGPHFLLRVPFDVCAAGAVCRVFIPGKQDFFGHFIAYATACIAA